MRTRVKICGITRSEDAQAAVYHGADAIGLVFYAPSPRAVTLEQAAAAVAGLPPFVTVTGLFVNPALAEVEAVLGRVRVDLLQFHGDESPEACGAFGRPYIKAIRMRDGVDLAAEKARYQQASGLLLDSFRPGVPGGTGERFQWERIPPALASGIVLAGGLDAANVASAIAQVRPYAVDVSGGVEREKGIKDPDKIAAFMRGVRRANH